jgi:hypothetical protein
MTRSSSEIPHLRDGVERPGGLDVKLIWTHPYPPLASGETGRARHGDNLNGKFSKSIFGVVALRENNFFDPPLDCVSPQARLRSGTDGCRFGEGTNDPVLERNPAFAGWSREAWRA